MHWPRFRRLNTFQAKVALLAAGIAVSLGLCGGFLIGGYVRLQAEQRRGEALAQWAELVAERLESEITERMGDLQFFSELEQLRDPSSPAARRRALLESARKADPELDGLAMVGSDGKVAVSANGGREGEDLSQQPAFVHGRLMPYLSQPRDGAMEFALPVYHRGQARGALTAKLDGEWAAKILRGTAERVRHQHPVELAVLDQHGLQIFGTTAQPRARRLPTGVSARLAKGSAHFLDSKSEELVGAARVRGPGALSRLGWTVVARQDAESAFATANRLEAMTRLFGLVLAVVFSWLGHLMARRLTRPLVALARVTRRLQDDPFHPLPPIKGDDEVSRLTVGLGLLIKKVAMQQRELERLNQQLAGEVEARTKELREALAKVEAAGDAKTEFLAHVSHELRTPLNGMLGMTCLLNETDLDGEQLEFTHTLRNSTENLLRIVNDLLDLSKVEAGKLELESRPFELTALVEEVLQGQAYAARARRLTLKQNVDRDLPDLVMGDAGRFRQVLANLLVNAVKFTSEGGVEVRVSRQGAASPFHARVEIVDTGMGVPAEAANRIFEAFSQADSSVQRKYGGTGLGLTICKKLVSLMGGEIGFQAMPTGGSLFWFTVKLSEAWEATQNAPAAGIMRPGAHVGRHALVVDDESDNRLVLCKMLQRLGFTVDEAADGREALEKLRGHIFHVVFMDCNMPGMDGFTATNLIRNGNAGDRAVPILAVTANAYPAQHRRCLAAGMDAFLSKPMTISGLENALDELLPPVPGIRGDSPPA